jgi:hypothetical protein
LKAILLFHHGKAKQNNAPCLESLVSFCYKAEGWGGRLKWVVVGEKGTNKTRSWGVQVRKAV